MSNPVNPVSLFISTTGTAHAEDLDSKNYALQQAVLRKNEPAVKQAISAFKENEVSRLSSSVIQIIKNGLMAPEQDSFGLEVKKILVDVLLKQDDFDINQIVANGETFLDVAEHQNDQKFVEFLCEKGAISSENLVRNEPSKQFISGGASGLTLGLATLAIRAAFIKEPLPTPVRTQFIVTKVLSSGLYFPLYEILNDKFKPANVNDMLWVMLSGYLAGVGSSIPLNGLNAIKYQCFQNGQAFRATVWNMWRCGGVKSFMRGIGSTSILHAVFGATYASSQHCVKTRWVSRDAGGTNAHEHLGNIAAGCAAAILTSPLQYARTIAFTAPPDSPAPSIYKSVCNLFQQAAASPHPVKTVIRNLNIGFGTARAGMGMWAGSVFYDAYKYQFMKLNTRSLS